MSQLTTNVTTHPKHDRWHYYGIAQGWHLGKWSKCKLEPCLSETKAIAAEFTERYHRPHPDLQ